MVALTLILSTVALLPIDIFLVSSTVDAETGLKKLWADSDTIYWMTFTVQIMYYSKWNFVCKEVVLVAYPCCPSLLWSCCCI